jgi:tripartite-type tricarboxylate transporter receptor subunit TctC
VGAIAARNAAPDGHTLFVGHKGTHSLYVLMTDKPEYDPVKDFRGISTFMVNSSILVVPASLPVKDVAGLLALAKSRPGGLNFASQGPGTSGHFLGEMFRFATGAPMVHIPMKGGGPAVTETVAGRTDMLFAAWSAAGEYIRDGRLRALAVASDTRSRSVPQAPTLPELGIRNVEFDTWFALFAPARTPDPIIARLNGEVAKAVASQEVVELLSKHDIVPKTSTPEEVTRLVVDETVRYADIVKRIGAKAN